jgi:TonB family protein
VALSAGIHVVAVVLAMLTTVVTPPDMDFITYEIELVSPPPAQAQEQPPEETAPEEELVVERPDPDPEPVVEEESAPVLEEDIPDPPVEEERNDPPPEEVAETDAPPPAEVTEEPPEETGEGIEVRMEGLRRDYPAYYDRIIRQMARCFRWRAGGNYEAVVRFTVERDGTVSDLSLVQRSGNPEFDFEALGAVECAGRPNRIGPLPEDFPWDDLPIQFSFRPQGREDT